MHRFYLQKMIEATKHNAEGYLDNPEIKEMKVDAVVLVGDPAEEVYAEQQLNSARALARDYLEEIVTRMKQKGITAESRVMFGTQQTKSSSSLML